MTTDTIATFTRGQQVTAKMTAQGMTEGHTYEVTQVLIDPARSATAYVYELDFGLTIRNGHILLKAAA